MIFLTVVLKDIAIIKNILMMNHINIPIKIKAVNFIVNDENIRKNTAEIGSSGKKTIEFQNTMLMAIGIEYLKLKKTDMILRHKARMIIENIINKVIEIRNINGSQDEYVRYFLSISLRIK